MNVQAPPIRTADDFLRAFEGVEGKREFVSGRVVDMMVNVSRNHMRLTTSLTLALANRLDPAAFDIGAADFGVRTAEGVRFPDVLVDRVGGSGRDLAAHEPLLVAEVLSPTSIARDFGPKAAEYTAIPSLLHYVVLAPDEPRVWLWRRDEEGRFALPEMIEGRDAQLPLAGLGLTLDLAELYRGVA